jgi:hypothetical protein
MLDTLKRELQRPSHLYRGGRLYPIKLIHLPGERAVDFIVPSGLAQTLRRATTCRIANGAGRRPGAGASAGLRPRTGREVRRPNFLLMVLEGWSPVHYTGPRPVEAGGKEGDRDGLFRTAGVGT